jgi:hypothetical protein
MLQSCSKSAELRVQLRLISTPRPQKVPHHMLSVLRPQALPQHQLVFTALSSPYTWKFQRTVIKIRERMEKKIFMSWLRACPVVMYSAAVLEMSPVRY